MIPWDIANHPIGFVRKWRVAALLSRHVGLVRVPLRGCIRERETTNSASCTAINIG